MELLWIGHAGVVIKFSEFYIAIDPFLSGSFKWHGKTNIYHGKSPWIGIPHKIEEFIQKIGINLKLIAITHKHKDHYDFSFLKKILAINKEVNIIAPRIIIKSLKSRIKKDSSGSIDLANRLYIINVNKIYEFLDASEEKTLRAIPLKKKLFSKNPKKVAFLIQERKNGNLFGVLHVGDTHSIDPFKPYFNQIDHLISWTARDFLKDIDYHIKQLAISKIWWVHWEQFYPGNFHCNQNIQFIMNLYKKWNIEQGILSYNEFISIN